MLIVMPKPTHTPPFHARNLKPETALALYTYKYNSVEEASYLRYSFLSKLDRPFLRILENAQVRKFGMENSFRFFSYLKYFEFFTFFATHQIDIPKPFRTISLKKFFLKKKTFILQWNSFLMRNGKRYSYLKLLLKAVTSVLNLNLISTPTYNARFWQYYYLYLFYRGTYARIELPTLVGETWFSTRNSTVTPGSKIFTGKGAYTAFFNTFLHKLNLIFSFYIYRVDKSIYKNSRGKSGKFTFVWKYIPVYKRKLLLMFWVNKEVQLSSQRTLQARLSQVVNILAQNPSNSWVWKIRKFSLNFVYFNFRRSLAESYKSILR